MTYGNDEPDAVALRDADDAASWTCHAGHPTTPPVEYNGAAYRFCPTCEDRAQDAAGVGEYHEGGIIVSTPADEPESDDPAHGFAGCCAWHDTPDVELTPDPAIVARALAEATGCTCAPQGTTWSCPVHHGADWRAR